MRDERKKDETSEEEMIEMIEMLELREMREVRGRYEEIRDERYGRDD